MEVASTITIFFLFEVLGIEPMASHMLGKLPAYLPTIFLLSKYLLMVLTCHFSDWLCILVKCIFKGMLLVKMH
jgi:hypothetical protein